ncbi:MAG: DUF131 domain-containing protein [Candidatus Bathyarchaeota archaeon]|nr:DUF131 domain-containing protein [Candidatus Termiticorpusculum sp.]
MLYTVAFILITVGILLVVGSLLISASKSRKAVASKDSDKVQGAGVLMFGPIPIIFGTDKNSMRAVMLIALVLTIVFVIWCYLMLR